MSSVGSAPSRTSERLAHLVVAARYPIVAGWAATAVLVTLLLPSIHQAGGGDLAGLVPEDNPAIEAEIRSVTEFGFPILSRVAVVQRDPDGFSALKQAEIVNRALRLTQHRYPGLERIGGALPLINTFGLVPGSREANTTAMTYLFFHPSMGFGEQTELARRFAREQVNEPDDHLVGVTGAIPARVGQADAIQRSLPLVEAATLAVIVLVVGLNYRAVAAPLVCLAAAGVAYLVAVRVVARLGQIVGVAVPSELEPLMVALAAGHRDRLRHLLPVRDAVPAAAGRPAPGCGQADDRRGRPHRGRRRADGGRGYGGTAGRQAPAVPGLRARHGPHHPGRPGGGRHPGPGPAGDRRGGGVLAEPARPPGREEHRRPAAGQAGRQHPAGAGRSTR